MSFSMLIPCPLNLKSFKICHLDRSANYKSDFLSVRPDWAIYWTLGNYSKPLATINLPNSLTFLGNFCNVSKSFILQVKSFLGNFYRHLAILYGSHCFLSFPFSSWSWPKSLTQNSCPKFIAEFYRCQYASEIFWMRFRYFKYGRMPGLILFYFHPFSLYSGK